MSGATTLESQMTPEQLSEAHSRFEKWQGAPEN